MQKDFERTYTINTTMSVGKCSHSQTKHLEVIKLACSTTITGGKMDEWEVGLDWKYLVYIAKNLPSNVFTTRLVMVKNTGGSRLNTCY